MKKDLINTISSYPNKEEFIIEWENGLIFEGTLDTMYETNNGLEEDEPGYKEYFASLFVINKVLAHSEESKKLKLTAGQLYEVSMEEPPKTVTHLPNKKIVWKNTA